MILELLLYIVNTFAIVVVAIVAKGFIQEKMKTTLSIIRKKKTARINDDKIDQ